MAQQHQNELKFPSLLDTTLYCEEEQWEEEIDKDDTFNDGNVDISKPISFFEQDLLWEEEELCNLFKKEHDFDFSNEFLFEVNPTMAVARNDAVEWMLKVSAYYYFSAVTTVLAVNYLDRFLFRFDSHGEKKPWMTQLAAVACLSVAAKIEESQVPLLLHLQVGDSKYVFEAKTIQRMEILVLSTLQWRMNLVTPLSFVDYISRRLGLKNHICWEFLRRCECFLLSIISDYRFVCYLPSVMAAATMLHVFRTVEPCLGVEYQEVLGILGINKEKVEECYKVISRIARTFHLHSINKRKYNRAMPGSPKGVMDVSFSSDSSFTAGDSWSVAAAASVSSSPEPPLKRARSLKNNQLEDDDEEDTVYHDATSDFPNI